MRLARATLEIKTAPFAFFFLILFTNSACAESFRELSLKPSFPTGREASPEVPKEDWELYDWGQPSFEDHFEDHGFMPSSPYDRLSIRATVREGQNLGASASLMFPEKTESVWMSFCIRLSENWRSSNSAGKLPGFAGDSSPSNGGQGGNPANGYNAWSARMMFGKYDSALNSVPLGFYVYHSDYASVSQYGDVEWWAPPPERLFSEAVSVKLNRWYAVTQQIRINSPNANDGQLRAWLDSELVYERNDFNFTNNEKFREIYRFWLNYYYGGASPATADHTVYFDQFSYSFGFNNTNLSCRSQWRDYIANQR